MEAVLISSGMIRTHLKKRGDIVEKTKEQVRQEFLEYIKELVKYWNELPQKTTTEKLDGLVFSIFNIFDGTTVALPAFDITVKPHPDDKQFHIAQSEDYYPDGLVINDDAHLHELWTKI